MEFDIYVLEDGTIRFVHSDELEEVFRDAPRETRRASHVEPCPGGWSADLSPVGGPVLGPFRSRGEALAAEVAWLKLVLDAGDLKFES